MRREESEGVKEKGGRVENGRRTKGKRRVIILKRNGKGKWRRENKEAKGMAINEGNKWRAHRKKGRRRK